MSEVSQHLRVLLNEIIEKHKLDLPLEAILAGRHRLDEGEHELLIDVLVYELSETGLHANDEPNERGLKIEALVDFFNAQRVRNNGSE